MQAHTKYYVSTGHVIYKFEDANGCAEFEVTLWGASIAWYETLVDALASLK